jgi:hypothetical protein
MALLKGPEALPRFLRAMAAFVEQNKTIPKKVLSPVAL